jgi:hypothetical protein
MHVYQDRNLHLVVIKRLTHNSVLFMPFLNKKKLLSKDKLRFYKGPCFAKEKGDFRSIYSIYLP